jgi:hypothetical protein
MTEDATAFVRQFAAGADMVELAVAGVADFDAGLPGQWSVREILAHMADAEVVRAVRIRLILGEDEPLLPVFDENAWRDRMAYGAADATVSLSTYSSVLRATAELLERSDATAFSRFGLHPAEGDLSVGTLVERGIAHARDHVQQILEMGW